MGITSSFTCSSRVARCRLCWPNAQYHFLFIRRTRVLDIPTDRASVAAPSHPRNAYNTATHSIIHNNNNAQPSAADVTHSFVMSQAVNEKFSLQVFLYQWLHSNHSVLDSSQPMVLSSTKMSQLKPNRMQDNDVRRLYIFPYDFFYQLFFVWKGGLNTVGKNTSYMCPQMCSLLCAHDLTRFETRC